MIDLIPLILDIIVTNFALDNFEFRKETKFKNVKVMPSVVPGNGSFGNERSHF